MTPRDDERASESGPDDAGESEGELSRTRRELNEALVLSALRAHATADDAEERAGALVELAELREQLLGILGHDLRNPLGAILMGARVLIKRGKLDEHDAALAARIVRSATRMNRMISQILELTRVRLGGGLVLERQRGVDLGQVCRNVAEELALAKSTHVQCVVEGDVSGFWDDDRLQEVVSNIAGNAVEHARIGTSVTLHAYVAGADVVVDICNEGLPIAPDVLPFIFEPFRRARQSELTKAGNLGLGLYIALEIVRAHGGSLQARSADGTTTFTMRLPRDSS